MRNRQAIGRLFFLPLALSAIALSGCASSGPLGVDPDRGFAGLKEIVSGLPDGGSVDIFLVHGMRGDGPPPSYVTEIEQIKRRLALKEDGTDLPIELVAVAPTVTMDGTMRFCNQPPKRLPQSPNAARSSLTQRREGNRPSRPVSWCAGLRRSICSPISLPCCASPN
jgi:hypothetical protein